MSATEHQLADDPVLPVLVDRAEACAILNVSDTTFARLLRENKFENMVCEGPRALYRRAELRRYRLQDRRLGAPARTVTKSPGEPSKSAPLRGSVETEIVADAGKALGTTNDTWPVCEGCQRRFRPRRAGMRSCSAACRRRVNRVAGAAPGEK